MRMRRFFHSPCNEEKLGSTFLRACACDEAGLREGGRMLLSLRGGEAAARGSYLEVEQPCGDGRAEGNSLGRKSAGRVRWSA